RFTISDTESHREMKLCSMDNFAIHPDFPSHQLDQAARDGQPQAGPSVFPSCRCISLGKCAKNRFLLVWRNPDPSVCYRKMKNAICSILRFNLALQGHFSL